MPELISRADAKAAGLPRYFTGKACCRGHVAERGVAGGSCVECVRDQARKAHAADPEKFRARVRADRAANPERYREYSRKSREANPEKFREASRLWCAANPEKRREARRKRYAADPERHREARRKRRAADPEKFLEAKRKRRAADPEKFLEAKRKRREADPEKFREYERAARAADPDKFRERGRAYRAADPEKFRARVRADRAANPVKWQEYSRKRYSADPEKFREAVRRRTALRRAADPNWRAWHNARWKERLAAGDPVATLRQAVDGVRRRLAISVAKGKLQRLGYSANDWRAHLASTLPPGVDVGEALSPGSDWSLDHVVPVSVVGRLDLPDEVKLRVCCDLQNLRLLPLADNISRQDGHPDEWGKLLKVLLRRHASTVHPHYEQAVKPWGNRAPLNVSGD